MDLLPDTQKCGLCMRRECRERFAHHHGLAIPTCITARAWRTCRNACRNRKLAIFFQVDGGENVPGIPCIWTTRKFAYLARGPWYHIRGTTQFFILSVKAGMVCRSSLHKLKTFVSQNLIYMLIGVKQEDSVILYQAVASLCIFLIPPTAWN